MKYIVCVVAVLLCAGCIADQCPESDRHPIVFFHGIFGSTLEEKFDIPSSVPMPHSSCPRKSKDWEPAWVEWKKIVPFSKFDCMTERFKMHPNDAGDQWFDNEGFEMRVPYWGTVKSVDPLCAELGNVIRMYGHAMDSLKKLGYEDNKTLFVAAYDWRKMPTDEWMKDVRALIERAVESTGKKAVIFTHSMGCAFSYMFMMAQTLEWRQKYIYHYLPVSPVWIGTNIIPFAMITDKLLFNITIQPFASVGKIFRYMQGSYVLNPSVVFNPDTLIATTDINTYTARNLSMLLERVGVKNAEVINKNVQEKLYRYEFEHPGIPITTLYSTGAKTLGPFHWCKDSLVGVDEPLPEFIEGDGLVPHDSLTYALKVWMQSKYADITEGVELPDTNHATATNNEVTIATVFKAACDSA